MIVPLTRFTMSVISSSIIQLSVFQIATDTSIYINLKSYIKNLERIHLSTFGIIQQEKELEKKYYNLWKKETSSKEIF